MKKLLVFVAGKYTGDEERCTKEAEVASIKLIRNGFWVITPQKNTFGYEKYEDENLRYETWTEMYREILLRCDLVYVLQNWVNSPGAKKEVEYAVDNGIAVVFEDANHSLIDHCTDVELLRCLSGITKLEEISKESRKCGI